MQRVPAAIALYVIAVNGIAMNILAVNILAMNRIAMGRGREQVGGVPAREPGSGFASR
jgi:hypothetical protein